MGASARRKEEVIRVERTKISSTHKGEEDICGKFYSDERQGEQMTRCSGEKGRQAQSFVKQRGGKGISTSNNTGG